MATITPPKEEAYFKNEPDKHQASATTQNIASLQVQSKKPVRTSTSQSSQTITSTASQPVACT